MGNNSGKMKSVLQTLEQLRQSMTRYCKETALLTEEIDLWFLKIWWQREIKRSKAKQYKHT